MSTLFGEPPSCNHVQPDGAELRDLGVARIRSRRPGLVRKLSRAFLAHLLTHGPSTSDPLRTMVPIPPEVDPRVVGATVLGLAQVGLIVPVGRRRSNRPAARHRWLELWALADARAAAAWLSANPELGPDDP